MNEEDINPEEGLEEDIKRNEERRQKEYDEATKGNEEIRKARSRRGQGGDVKQLDIPGLFEARSGLRTTAALGTEIFLNTLVDPLFEPGTQVAAGTLINALAQRIRGGEISKGELAASGLASLIPGGAQGRAITQFVKGTGKGALSGAIETAGMAGIDEGRLPTKEELAAGLGIGAAFGGIVSTPQARKALQDVRARIKGQYTPITAYAMAPQQAALGAVPDPFKKGTPKRQQFGPYPQLPVNAEVKNAVDIDAAKDDIIATFSGKKTIRTPQGKGPLIYELNDGSNVMFEVDLRGDNGIFRRDQLIAVPATEVALDSRKVLESVPEDLEYWIENTYGPDYLEQYKTWVKGGRDRLVDVKKEMQEAILSMRAKEVQREIKYSYPPGDPRTRQALARFNTPQNQRLIKLDEAKLEDSHILSIGTKGKLTRTGLTKGVDRALQGSAVAGKRTPNVTRNFPKGSRVYDPPAAYQSFIEYWRLNRARGAGIALENVPEEEAIQQLQELGLPTSWLEDFINFALLDIGIRKELTNKDIVKLLKQGFSAEAVIEQRLRKLAREKANLDITDFAYKMQELSPEEAIKAIDERYQREILAGTRPGDAFKE
tara:strand:+ start:54 stop:1859 length:1806 start_codon:yes stop_codon:yes gene_type:complete